MQVDAAAVPPASDVSVRAAEHRLLVQESLDAVVSQLSTAVLQLMGPEREAGTDELRTTLDQVGASVDRALVDLRFLVRLQRGPTGLGDSRSALVDPGLVESLADRSAHWATRLRHDGFAVEVELSPETQALSRATTATLVRTLDHAGGRVLRHAPPRSVCRLIVEVLAGDVCLRITNPLPEPRVAEAAEALELSNGLEGLRHRVELSGGRLFAGPVHDPDGRGSWIVQVVLPL